MEIVMHQLLKPRSNFLVPVRTRAAAFITRAVHNFRGAMMTIRGSLLMRQLHSNAIMVENFSWFRRLPRDPTVGMKIDHVQ